MADPAIITVEFRQGRKGDAHFLRELSIAETEAIRRVKADGFDVLRARGIRLGGDVGINVKVYLKGQVVNRIEDETYEGFIEIDNRATRPSFGSDPHRLSIRFPAGSERVVLEAPTARLPGASDGGATRKMLGRIAQSLGIKFVWRPVNDE